MGVTLEIGVEIEEGKKKASICRILADPAGVSLGLFTVIQHDAFTAGSCRVSLPPSPANLAKGHLKQSSSSSSSSSENWQPNPITSCIEHPPRQSHLPLFSVYVRACACVIKTAEAQRYSTVCMCYAQFPLDEH